MSTEKYQQSSENSAYLEVLFSIYGCRPVQFTVAVVLTVMYRSLKKSVLFSSQSVCACASYVRRLWVTSVRNGRVLHL